MWKTQQLAVDASPIEAMECWQLKEQLPASDASRANDLQVIAFATVFILQIVFILELVRKHILNWLSATSVQWWESKPSKEGALHTKNYVPEVIIHCFCSEQ